MLPTRPPAQSLSLRSKRRSVAVASTLLGALALSCAPSTALAQDCAFADFAGTFKTTDSFVVAQNATSDGPFIEYEAFSIEITSVEGNARVYEAVNTDLAQWGGSFSFLCIVPPSKNDELECVSTIADFWQTLTAQTVNSDCQVLTMTQIFKAPGGGPCGPEDFVCSAVGFSAHTRVGSQALAPAPAPAPSPSPALPQDCAFADFAGTYELSDDITVAQNATSDGTFFSDQANGLVHEITPVEGNARVYEALYPDVTYLCIVPPSKNDQLECVRDDADHFFTMTAQTVDADCKVVTGTVIAKNPGGGECGPEDSSCSSVGFSLNTRVGASEAPAPAPAPSPGI